MYGAYFNLAPPPIPIVLIRVRNMYRFIMLEYARFVMFQLYKL